MTEKIQISKNGRNGWYRLIINTTEHSSTGIVINNQEAKQFFNDLREILNDDSSVVIEQLETEIKYIPKLVEREIIQEKIKIVEKEIVVEVPRLKIIEKSLDYTVDAGIQEHICTNDDIIKFLKNADTKLVQYILKESNIDFGIEEFIIVDDDHVSFGDRKTKLVPALKPISDKHNTIGHNAGIREPIKNLTFLNKIKNILKKWF